MPYTVYAFDGLSSHTKPYQERGCLRMHPIRITPFRTTRLSSGGWPGHPRTSWATPQVCQRPLAAGRQPSDASQVRGLKDLSDPLALLPLMRAAGVGWYGWYETGTHESGWDEKTILWLVWLSTEWCLDGCAQHERVER